MRDRNRFECSRRLRTPCADGFLSLPIAVAIRIVLDCVMSMRPLSSAIQVFRCFQHAGTGTIGSERIVTSPSGTRQHVIFAHCLFPAW